ncbi:MAG TPA: ribonuclease HII [Rhodocyclaceae bacterium]|nr:ribonuclease HII [Rhodocyclaceae bacterium]
MNDIPAPSSGYRPWSPSDDSFSVASLVCGVDEAGRGPLAGPVVAAAVILDPAAPLAGLAGLADSKLLSPRQRERMAVRIKAQALAWSVASASVAEIDALNILQASLLAMRRAVAGLAIRPQRALVDGNQDPGLDCHTETIPGGDRSTPAISAASILAKTTRDAWMCALHQRHPLYGFDRHMGYPTRQHIAALKAHGPISEHRRSFRPVALLLRPDPRAGSAPPG